MLGAALSGCKHSQPSALMTPSAEALAQPAPDTFRVQFQTSRGRFTMEAIRAWAPRGVDRFHYLVSNGFYDGARFFRNLPNFVAQFGIHGDPDVSEVWEDRTIPDDPVTQSNAVGTVTFATGGPDTRSTQLFINKRDNSRLDAMGFTPIGRVIEGMDVVMKLNEQYGEGPPRGTGPDQSRIRSDGNEYLNRFFPNLDYIVTARVIR